MTESMAPFRELVSIQTKMLEELARQQMECTGLHRSDHAADQRAAKVQTPNDMIELQQAYAKELEATLRAANEQNLKALTTAQQAMQQLTQQSVEAMTGKK